MRFQSIVLFLSLSLAANCFADNRHLHPKGEQEGSTKPKQGMMYPGFCEIEIINDSYSNVRVFGTFDDYTTLQFNIYRFEYPHYISLFYDFYCHDGMFLTIQTPYQTVYSAWTGVGTTLHLVPYLNKVKAEVSATKK